MTPQKYNLHDGKKGAALAIRVTPRARKNEIFEVANDGTVKVRLTASSEEDETNKALVEFLSDVLEIPTNRIEIVAGTAGRDKLVSILDLGAEAVQQKILKHLA